MEFSPVSQNVSELHSSFTLMLSPFFPICFLILLFHDFLLFFWIPNPYLSLHSLIPQFLVFLYLFTCSPISPPPFFLIVAFPADINGCTVLSFNHLKLCSFLHSIPLEINIKSIDIRSQFNQIVSLALSPSISLKIDHLFWTIRYA